MKGQLLIMILALTTADLVVGQAPVNSAEAGTRPVFELQLVERPPTLDGRLDDPCWQHTPGLTNFTQVLPVDHWPRSTVATSHRQSVCQSNRGCRRTTSRAAGRESLRNLQ